MKCENCRSSDVTVEKRLYYCYPSDPDFNTHDIEDTVLACNECFHEETLNSKKVIKNGI